MDRIAFLKEQINADNKPAVNATFLRQVEVLQSGELHKLDSPIIMRKEHLKNTFDIKEADRLFCVLEALEWQQRQAGACSRP